MLFECCTGGGSKSDVGAVVRAAAVQEIEIGRNVVGSR